MLSVLISLFQTARLSMHSRAALQLEILALRHLTLPIFHLSLAIFASEQKIVDVGAAAGHSAADAIRIARGCRASLRPQRA
jgi:hypothetical protein